MAQFGTGMVSTAAPPAAIWGPAASIMVLLSPLHSSELCKCMLSRAGGPAPGVHSELTQLPSVCILLSSLPTSALVRTLTSQLLWERFPFVGAPPVEASPGCFPNHCNHQISRLWLSSQPSGSEPRFLTSFLHLKECHPVLTIQFLPCFPSDSHCVPAHMHVCVCACVCMHTCVQVQVFVSFWVYTL